MGTKRPSWTSTRHPYYNGLTLTSKRSPSVEPTMPVRSAFSLIVFTSLLIGSTAATAAPPVWQANVDKLSSKDPLERSKAADELAKLANSPDAPGAVAAITKTLSSPDN